MQLGSQRLEPRCCARLVTVKAIGLYGNLPAQVFGALLCGRCDRFIDFSQHGPVFVLAAGSRDLQQRARQQGHGRQDLTGSVVVAAATRRQSQGVAQSVARDRLNAARRD
ncbi:hypothetical protein D9M72_599200 [compost metagenome]